MVIAAAIVVVGAGPGSFQRPTARSPAPATGGAAGRGVGRSRPHRRATRPAPAPTPHRPRRSDPPAEPGTMTIAAVGLVDPADPRYQGDKDLLQRELRADSRSQLVEKAVGLLVDPASIAANYDLLQRRVLADSSSFVKTVVRESEPRLGKDGLMSMTTEAVVNVRAVQKSLNQMTRDERVQLIRASGDPRVSLQIDVRDATCQHVSDVNALRH
jgi:serine/threonine-protein kinase